MDQKFYQAVLEALTDGVYLVDIERRITFWNKAAERISGYSAAEIIGRSCADRILRHMDDEGVLLCEQGCPLAATMVDGKVREANVYLHHKFGHRVPVFVRASPMRDEEGNIVGAVEVFTENSPTLNMLQEMEKLKKEALTDQLTGIGNRRYADIIIEKLEAALAADGVRFGVLFVDIDHFKNINDTWGHMVGDRVLTMVSSTLSGTLRPLDSVCRWGGEEFVILVSNTSEEGLAVLAARLRMLVESSWLDHEGQQISVTASFGGAVSGVGESGKSVIKRADYEVYRSKKDGRNRVYIGGVCTSSRIV